MERKNRVLVVDFGGQYNLLIARRVRDLGIYCELTPPWKAVEKIKEFEPGAIIFSGGPATVFSDNARLVDKSVLELGVPVLGICYGQQLMAHLLGGRCVSAEPAEYGKVTVTHSGTSALFKDIPATSVCWMSHGVSVADMPQGFAATATTADCACAAMEDAARGLYGIQFHPEVMHTEHGAKVLENFLFGIASLKRDWSMADYAVKAIADAKAQIGDGKVLLGLSGGVDSSVCAALLSRAVGSQLTCVFVDTGLMRKNEGKEVAEAMKVFEARYIHVDAEARFLARLKGVTDPEQKRKIVGEEFIRVFEEESKKIGAVDYLAQGTIYPDIVESGMGGESQVIKSHHNVGGLPEFVDFKEIVEPLKDLFKDEVRQLGIELGLPEALVWRQPFPGPGLSIRCIGEVRKDRLDILRDADAIFREEIAAAGLHRSVNQYFAVLTNIQTVGVMGDERTYDYTLALRGVESVDFMTAAWARIPYDVLEKASSRIVNEVGHINRICYDITSKPPATIEWE